MPEPTTDTGQNDDELPSTVEYEIWEHPNKPHNPLDDIRDHDQPTIDQPLTIRYQPPATSDPGVVVPDPKPTIAQAASVGGSVEQMPVSDPLGAPPPTYQPIPAERSAQSAPNDPSPLYHTEAHPWNIPPASQPDRDQGSSIWLVPLVVSIVLFLAAGMYWMSGRGDGSQVESSESVPLSTAPVVTTAVSPPQTTTPTQPTPEPTAATDPPTPTQPPSPPTLPKAGPAPGPDPAPDPEPDPAPDPEPDPAPDPSPSAYYANAEESGCFPGSDTGLPDGRWVVFVNSGGVDAADGTVTFDLICYFTGDAAIDAATARGDELPQNGVYVVNDNDRLRTMPIDQNADVSFQANGDFRSGTVAEWEQELATNPSTRQVELAVSNGRIVLAEELYRP